MELICDTHALIWWALRPEALSNNAHHMIEQARQHNGLLFADISYWEIAMLIKRKKLAVNISCAELCELIELIERSCGQQGLQITAQIAELSQDDRFVHGDPADRLIAATAICNNAKLLTKNQQLHQVHGLHCIW